MAENKVPAPVVVSGPVSVNGVVISYPALVALASGRVVFQGMFGGGRAVEFSGKGGRVFHQSKCLVLTDETGGSITVTEFLPDGVDWEKWKPDVQRGVNVFGICRGLEESSGVLVANAKIVAC